jgi:hypothetical protein
MALVISIALVGAAGGWLAKACAPEFLTAVFSYKRHPDLPRSGFVDGRLGVLQPTFARSYLVIAYRYLNGIGMNPSEREQARDYYKDRETGSWDHSGTDWPKQWREVRSRIKSPPPPHTPLITGGQLSYDAETHSFVLNCAEDAFRVAIHTLDARRRQFGVASLSFRSWIDAQDKVFENCQGGPAVIPPSSTSGLPVLIRADRDYQIAAAYFYAGHYQTALDLFRRISQATASPWSMISRYLVVRTLQRMTENKETIESAGEQLQSEAQNILADSKLTSIRGMTWNLVERAGIRKRDQNYFRELARLLSSKGQDDGFREELWNYTDMYDGVIGEADPNRLFPPEKAIRADASRFQDADLTDWIFCFQSRDSSTFSHSLARWKQTRSLAWLLAALSHASATTAAQDRLLDAGAGVSESSPAFLTSRFHLFRLQEQLGNKQGARDGLTALLASPLLKDLPSSMNLFRGLRMLAAPTFEDFLQFAFRKPVMVTFQMNIGEAPNFYGDTAGLRGRMAGDLFDHDATRVLNRDTPFSLLKQAALSDSIPADLRGEALMTAFTRGLMLDEDLAEIAKKMAVAEPDLAPLVDKYLQETSDDGRRFAAAFLILQRPEARPYFASGISRQTRPGKLDSYRDNWWCPMDIEIELDSRANQDQWYSVTQNVLQRSTDDVTPDFLAGSAAVESKKEFARLGTLSAATDFLGGIVFQFADSHPDDARIPEALHNLVRSGHFGCADVDTWKTVRSAFRLLHLRYPQSAWTKRTPTWLKNESAFPRAKRAQQP